MDIVGPLSRSRSGNKYVLVVCDYGTRYPEAVPLWNITVVSSFTERNCHPGKLPIIPTILIDQNFLRVILKAVHPEIKKARRL